MWVQQNIRKHFKTTRSKTKAWQYFDLWFASGSFFHLPVWLQTDFSGEILWAYNLEHLDFLAAHIGAKLRERNGFQFRVRSIGARLPRWMTSAGNREAVLKAIEKLREKAGFN